MEPPFLRARRENQNACQSSEKRTSLRDRTLHEPRFSPFALFSGLGTRRLHSSTRVGKYWCVLNQVFILLVVLIAGLFGVDQPPSQKSESETFRMRCKPILLGERLKSEWTFPLRIGMAFLFMNGKTHGRSKEEISNQPLCQSNDYIGWERLAKANPIHTIGNFRK